MEHINYHAAGFPDLDLADQCDWEDHMEFMTLAEAGIEESPSQPMFGLQASNSSSIEGYVEWWLEEDSALQLH